MKTKVSGSVVVSHTDSGSCRIVQGRWTVLVVTLVGLLITKRFFICFLFSHLYLAIIQLHK